MPIVTIHNKIFDSDISLNEPNTMNLTNDSLNTFSTSQFISLPDENDPSGFAQYRFKFWFIKDEFYTTQTVTMANVGSTDFEAKAWYTKVGPGRPGIWVASFNKDTGNFENDNPIGSVTPSSAWNGTSKSITSVDSAIRIDAKDTIGVISGSGGLHFKTWKAITGTPTITGDDISVDKGESSLAVAVYSAVPIDGEIDPHLGSILELEADHVFNRIREKLGDWVKDPAPFDLARILGEIKVQSTKIKDADQLTKIIMKAPEMSKKELLVAEKQLKVESQRLEVATKLLKEAMGKK